MKSSEIISSLVREIRSSIQELQDCLGDSPAKDLVNKALFVDLDCRSLFAEYCVIQIENGMVDPELSHQVLSIFDSAIKVLQSKIEFAPICEQYLLSIEERKKEILHLGQYPLQNPTFNEPLPEMAENPSKMPKLRFQMIIDLNVKPYADDQEVEEKVVLLYEKLSAYNHAKGGTGLTIEDFQRLIGARVPEGVLS